MADNVDQATVEVGDVNPATVDGTALQNTHLPGSATTVSGLAAVTGGVGAGNLFETEVDRDIFMFHQDETPLTQLSLLAHRVKVDSPVVDHFMIDEERSFATVKTTFTSEDYPSSAVIVVDSNDQHLIKEYDTLLVDGVDGDNGSGLCLYVIGVGASDGNPIVAAINKTHNSASYVPTINAGTKLRILNNACSETQKIVPPSSSIPVKSTVHCQKQVMNRIVSLYFDSQKKRIDFKDRLLAEKDLSEFKRKRNRTLWAGAKGKLRVYNKETKTYEDCYFSEGIRWQFKKEYIMPVGERWTFERFIALAKMFYTGEDVPQEAIFLCGKDLLEGIQNIDWMKHPEVRVEASTNNIGWSITKIHTVFGDFQLRRDATLDVLGWGNCGAIIGGVSRLTRYDRSSEHSFNEKLDDAEAKREGVIMWDGIALKGGCNIWVNGNAETSNSDAFAFETWDDADTDPTVSTVVNGRWYYFLYGATLSYTSGGSTKTISVAAGEIWKPKVEAVATVDTITGWTKYEGLVAVNS